MNANFRIDKQALMHPDMAWLIRKALSVTPESREMILIVAKRVKALTDGVEPLIPGTEKMSNTEIALRELIARKIGPTQAEDERRREYTEVIDQRLRARFPSLARK